MSFCLVKNAFFFLLIYHKQVKVSGSEAHTSLVQDLFLHERDLGAPFNSSSTHIVGFRQGFLVSASLKVLRSNEGRKLDVG